LVLCNGSNKTEGKGEIRKVPISLQDLRRSLYIKAKAEPAWRFWGLYVHVCRMETLQEAYRMAKQNDGAPGIDEVTFETIEEGGTIGPINLDRKQAGKPSAGNPHAGFDEAGVGNRLTVRIVRHWSSRQG
jgi:hypothetical protein